MLVHGLAVLLSVTALSVLAHPAGPNLLESRAAVDNIVFVTNTDKFCMIMPRDAHTNIGDSEHPGGTKKDLLFS